MPAASRQNQDPDPRNSRPTIPIGRLFALTVATAAFAFALQALLAVTDAPAAPAISLIVVPVAAGGAIFFGLRPYARAGRIRLAMMVAAALFLLGLALT